MEPNVAIEPLAGISLETIQYDAARLMLELKFRGCGNYQFFGVSNSIYTGLKDASSPIEFFDAHIKGRYSTHYA